VRGFFEKQRIAVGSLSAISRERGCVIDAAVRLLHGIMLLTASNDKMS